MNIFEYVYNDGVVTPDELSDLSTNLKGIVDKLKSKNGVLTSKEFPIEILSTLLNNASPSQIFKSI